MGLMFEKHVVSPFQVINSTHNCKKCALLIFFLISLFVFFCALTSPNFLEFEEMSNILVPFQRQNESNGLISVCDHPYENQWSAKEIDISYNITELELIEFASLSNITKGGFWSPERCLSKYRITIVIPYRNRPHQLRTFLHYIHRFLAEQLIEHRVVVVEQTSDYSFNRGKLLNIGFVEMQQDRYTECYIFHDVDLLPRSLNNIYACSNMPRHMSSAIDTFGYYLPYQTNFGGVTALLSSCFQKINGYSNMFYGWGGEDDDFYYRTAAANFGIVRFKPAVSNYTSLKHDPEKPNPERHDLLRRSKRSHLSEGLNSLYYTLVAKELLPLYTRLLVSL